MPQQTSSFKKTIYEAGKILALVVLLMLVAIGQTSVVMTAKDVDRSFIVVVVLTFTLIFSVVTFWNVYRLIPRLLLRGKYYAYVAAMVGISLFIVLTGIVYEWTMYKIYRLPAGEYGFFAGNNIFIFDFLANFICYFISLIATSLIVFLRRWRKSGDRIHELEETGIRVELEKTRHKIDSGALFDILDKAASVAVSFPQEASRMLMELSKSLRQQLYESEYRQAFSNITEKTACVFREQDRLLNFLIEKRYRLTRNLLLILAVCLIGSANIDPRVPFSFLEFTILSGAFLAFGYFNVYVLIPFFLFKKKLIKYGLSIVIMIVSFLLLLLPSDLIEVFSGLFGIYLVSSVAQIGFVFIGMTAFVLFQHWAQNERYIARLEATTMRAELEQLQNQINPHFLFNMLNNILVLIRENPEEAVVIMHKMSEMLKYQFIDSTKKEVTLNDDIHFLTDFLNLEKIRRDRFEFGISVEDHAENLSIPPLLFIPFVENAVKHSADAVNLSYIKLHFKLTGNMLHFTCHNSKPLKPRKKNVYSGLGLANIRRRLDLLYETHYSLNRCEDETTYTVQLAIKI